MHINYRKLLWIIQLTIALSLTVTACYGRPTPTPGPTPTPKPPTVKIEPLPPSVQAGVSQPVKAEIAGTYTDVKFKTDNGIIKQSVSKQLVYWTPLDSDKPASIGVEVFYSGSAKPVEDVVAVTVKKAPKPACPPSLIITTPVSNTQVVHNLMVTGQVGALEEGTRLRLATWPYVTNNYHPQEAKPDGESWTVTVYVGPSEKAGAGEKFDLVVFIVNAAGDFRMDEYIKKAKQTGQWPGMSSIEGATECLRITNLTRK